MKILPFLFLYIALIISCTQDSFDEEFNPLNQFTYDGQSYQTPKFGMVNVDQISSNTYEVELVLMSENHRFDEIEGVGYNISGSTGPIVIFTFQSENEDHITPGTYDLSKTDTNYVIKAFAVTQYSPPGSFNQMIRATECQITISELNNTIEINYEFNSSGSSPLQGYYTLSADEWYKR
jgi:hypothetical protein